MKVKYEVTKVVTEEREIEINNAKWLPKLLDCINQDYEGYNKEMGDGAIKEIEETTGIPLASEDSDLITATGAITYVKVDGEEMFVY